MKYQYLNLEQKLTKIRKKIPVLIKQFHSDEVGYDFSKLDDIYELMTPALNKYSVNFDIIGEKPTMHDEGGHPLYLTMDKDGYWRYEANLVLCWTNADLPEQKRMVNIHAVGTHEVPDKAKGAAWTYALKYYLRNKFCVPQGSGTEDPDMRGTDTLEEQQEQTEKENSSRQKQGNPVQEREKKEPVKQEQKSEKVKEMPVKANTEKKSASGTGAKDVKSLAEKKAEHRTKKDTGDLTEEKQVEPVLKKPADEQAKTQKANKVKQEDDFEPISEEEEVPFDDYEDEGGFMDDLNEELGMKETEDTSAYEAARNYICTFGIFKGKTLGDMLDSGKKGKDGLRWLSTSYKGSDAEMVKAAKLLLAADENNTEAMAA